MPTLDFRQFVRKHSVPVSDQSGSERALSKINTLRALELLIDSDTAVLGGDVYRMDRDRMRPTYDNWYTERAEGESIIDFAVRSRRAAEEYVGDYADPEDGSIFYVLVVR